MTRDRDLLALGELVLCRGTGEPNSLSDIVVSHFIVDAVAAHHNKVMVLADLERNDVRLCFHNVWVASPKLQLRFCVPERSAYGQTTRQDSDRPHYVLWVLAPLHVINFFDVNALLSLRWLLRVHRDCCGLVDLASSLYDSVVLVHIGWLVVSGKSRHPGSLV